MPGLVLGPLFREASARFSARICARQNFYSVPVAYAGRRVQVRLRANEVAAYDGVTLLARHERSPGRGREVLEFDHYLEVLVIKAGALPGLECVVCGARVRTIQRHARPLLRRG